VLPEGKEPRTVAAASIVQERGIARCVLLGPPDEIRETARKHGVALPASIEIIDPAQVASRYVEPLVQRRKAKGMTPDQAALELADTVMLGTMMMALDEADGLVSGAVHTTAHTIRPALQLVKTAPGCELVSSVFFMCLPEQVLVFGDCAVNPNPTAEQLADIALQSAESARAFGIEPRVAMLSYSTGTSGAGEEVEKVKRATDLARSLRPDLALDGPLQYDAAVMPDVARQKAPKSPVAGRATVLVFPDLNTGNVTYKAVQRSANVVSIGPMLQGLAKPVNDLSRGCLVEDIVFTIALTAIQAQQLEGRRGG
jgi:phosphate acetyltransferase